MQLILVIGLSSGSPFLFFQLHVCVCRFAQGIEAVMSAGWGVWNMELKALILDLGRS